MAKRNFTSVGHKTVRNAAEAPDAGGATEAVSAVEVWHDGDAWPRIRGGLMSIHLLALTTAVIVHATNMLSAPRAPWGHVVLAVLLVPLSLETTRHIVRSSQHVATQLRLASGMSLITLGVLLAAVSPSALALATCMMGGALLLYGQASNSVLSPAEGSGVSSTQR